MVPNHSIDRTQKLNADKKFVASGNTIFYLLDYNVAAFLHLSVLRGASPHLLPYLPNSFPLPVAGQAARHLPSSHTRKHFCTPETI